MQEALTTASALQATCKGIAACVAAGTCECKPSSPLANACNTGDRVARAEQGTCGHRVVRSATGAHCAPASVGNDIVKMSPDVQIFYVGTGSCWGFKPSSSFLWHTGRQTRDARACKAARSTTIKSTRGRTRSHRHKTKRQDTGTSNSRHRRHATSTRPVHAGRSAQATWGLFLRRADVHE